MHSVLIICSGVKTQYAYPPSSGEDNDDDDDPVSPSKAKRPIPLAQRLRMLQSEIASLEADCSDPSNPLIREAKDQDGVDPGELIMGLVDVRGRLDKIRKVREGRGKLVGVLTSEQASAIPSPPAVDEPEKKLDKVAPVRNLVEMDKRVGELEKLVGASSASLDEV